MMVKLKSFTPISGAAGLGFAILIALANAIAVPAGLPTPGTAFRDAAAFFAGGSTALDIATALGPLTWTLATIFAAGAVVTLWRSELARGWALVGLSGLLLQNGAFTVVIALRLALASAPPTEGLWALHETVFTLNGTFLAIAMLGLSLGGLRAGLIRPWHAGLGLVSAALMFTSATLSLALPGLFGWLLWVVWIGAYGVVLIRADR
ncbi:hypothetical protein ALI144C_08875 [Actinosynnema sp. ALI-1.44]|uniref:hypothetical protein n=1 Tax=Actinosynnema sp. ALI-1.44 TaxID=1933779 RepID=UPI00097C5EC3|nr:hypothetical protein [Actinosynnema sp. ALI-1.44]ONI87494.1 hypothetical protein ALI144C_08875 [Actinosynnema sp. ALI-1.44]